MSDDVPMTPVADLGRQCSFPVGYRPTRTSNTCWNAATSLVEDPDRGVYEPCWRCDEHAGVLDNGQSAPIVREMPTDLISRV
jgi:hypothetical protein